jgi:hypothetical protein
MFGADDVSVDAQKHLTVLRIEEPRHHPLALFHELFESDGRKQPGKIKLGSRLLDEDIDRHGVQHTRSHIPIPKLQFLDQR